MGKLFYGTQTGTTEGIAQAMQQALPDLIGEVKNIYGTPPAELESADFLVLGGSTWGDGELTDDWADYLPKLDQINFAGKKVALFGLGDQYSYSYNFVSAMKILYDKVKERGGEIIADQFSTQGFEYDHSEAVVDGNFIGLVVDEVNQPELTDARIQTWANQVRAQVGGLVSA